MSQADLRVTTIPSAPPTLAALTLYFPEIQHKAGAYIPEMAVADSARARIVADIATGQCENVTRVIGVDLANGRSFDASSEIAREVLDRVLDVDGRIPNHCREFLETHLGVFTVMAAEWDAA